MSQTTLIVESFPPVWHAGRARRRSQPRASPRARRSTARRRSAGAAALAWRATGEEAAWLVRRVRGFQADKSRREEPEDRAAHAAAAAHQPAQSAPPPMTPAPHNGGPSMLTLTSSDSSDDDDDERVRSTRYVFTAVLYSYCR